MGISDIIAGFIQQELDNAGGALELQRSDLTWTTPSSTATTPSTPA